MTYIPYTYRVICPDGMMYYGVKYANNKRDTANPATFWDSYFTSSSKIHEMLKQFDKREFKTEIRKTFSTKEEAISWESKVNKYTTMWPNYLNNSFVDGRDQSNRNNGNYGKPQKDEAKKMMVASRRSRFGGMYYDPNKLVNRTYMTSEWKLNVSIKQKSVLKNKILAGKFSKRYILSREQRDEILFEFDKFKFPTDHLAYKTKGSRTPVEIYFARKYISTCKVIINAKHPTLVIKALLKYERSQELINIQDKINDAC